MIKRRSLTRLVALAAVRAATFSGVGTARANSSGWTIVPSPNFGTYDILQALAAVSSSDVWAAGYYTLNSTNRTLIEHWNGLFWQTVTSPNEGKSDNFLCGLAAVSANDVWAVGYYADSSSDVATLTEHWNGVARSIVSSPDQPGGISSLTAISVVATNDVWAVGDDASDGFNQTLVEEQTGSSLQSMASPNAGTGDALAGVAAIGSNDVWAVGDYSNSSGTYTLIEHYTSGGPTMSRLAQVSVHRTGGFIVVRWRLADQTGIAGFNLYAGTHRVNQQLIPVDRASSYRYAARWIGSGPFSVRAVRATH